MSMFPKCKRFLKKVDGEFAICAEIGEKGYAQVEYHNLRYTLYQYTVYGIGRFGVIEESGVSFEHNDPNPDPAKRLLSTKNAMGKNTLFVADEDFHIIGFGSLDMDVDWDGKLVTESFVCDNDKSWIICFDGRPIVNDIELAMYDYTKLEVGKSYNIDIKDGALGVFTKLC